MNHPKNSKYTRGRHAARIVELLGAVIIFIALVVALIGAVILAYTIAKSGLSNKFGLIGGVSFLFYSVSGFVTGLLLFLAGRTSVAVMDNADSTRQMLQIMQRG